MMPLPAPRKAAALCALLWLTGAASAGSLRVQVLDSAGKPLEGEALVARVGQDFDAFLERRAALVVLAAQHLTDGRLLTLEQLMSAAQTAAAAAEPALAE